MFANFYKNKRVLVTGHTGFKGSWLIAWLTSLGAEVFGLSDCVMNEECHYNLIKEQLKLKGEFWGDVADLEFTTNVLSEVKPDFVFHLAAQAIVGRSFEVPFLTWKTNALGTVSVLEAVRINNLKCVCIMITSDKCYENHEWIWGYRENDQLGGVDPYSSSKAAAEIAISSFTRSYTSGSLNGLVIGSARAGNVIGGGDWSEGRIIPDLMRSWMSGDPLQIRNGNATRPWQHVLEPISGYLTLGYNLYFHAEHFQSAFNFGPNLTTDLSVSDLIDEITSYFPDISIEFLNSSKNSFYEAGLLRLNCDKAASVLNWTPTLDFHQTIYFTADWYKKFYNNTDTDIFEITKAQITEYSEIAMKKSAVWCK